MMTFASMPVTTIASPIILGGLAVYFLLPKPGNSLKFLGVALGLLAMLLFGMSLLREAASGPKVEAILFYSFSGLAILGGVALVTQTNPARGAVAFALVVLSTCGLFLLQGAPFLTAGTIIIYAGAIVVTFLFVIMLSQQDGPSDADQRSREPFLSCLAAGMLLVVLASVIVGQYDTTGIDQLLNAIDVVAKKPGKVDLEPIKDAYSKLSTDSPAHNALGRHLEDLEGKLVAPDLPSEQATAALDGFRKSVLASARSVGDFKPSETISLSPFAGAPANRTPGALPAANVAGLGRTLFSDYLLGVEMGGTLLLVATIGAIAITHRTRRAA